MNSGGPPAYPGDVKRLNLLSCGSCHRQLDVTAMAIGDQVMCVCDELLVVGPPRQVTVSGLACGHCGGTIAEGDEECSYCRAALSAADRLETTLCPLCATRLPNDSQHCKSCGVELRASAVPALPREGQCPSCEGALRVHLLPEAELVECDPEEGCGGIWADRSAFQRIQRNARAASVEGRSTPPRPVEETGGGSEASARSRMYLPCLTCGELMQRRQFRIAGAASGIVLDVCRDHGMWFDRDELERALAFVAAQAVQHTGEGPVDATPLPRRSPRKPPPAHWLRRGNGKGNLWGSLFETLADLGDGFMGRD